MAERIKERRVALNFTQEELAHKLGLQKSAIAKYENGRVENIKRSIISEMANVLDCSPSYLMGWADEPKITTSDRAAVLAVKLRNDIDAIELLERYYALSDEKKTIAQNMIQVLEDK